MSEALLGIDLGTSSAKSVFFSPGGDVLGEGSAEYGIDSPRRGWAEQSPETWWNAATASVRKAAASAGGPLRLRGIGLSGQMHGLVCLDGAKNLLRPAILWADQRSGAEAAQINALLEENGLYVKTLNKASSGFLLSSLLWIQGNEPETARNIAHVLLPKDYIRFRLTGEIAAEPSDACGTGVFDVSHVQWLGELLRYFSISADVFPRLLPSSSCAGILKRDAAEELGLGLDAGVPVASGAGDQAAQAVGNGLIRSGAASSNIGTAGQFFVASASPLYDPELRCNCFVHAQEGLWYLLGANLAAGFCLNWLWRYVLGKDAGYDEAARLAAGVPAGSRGLLFHPYLNGDRTPHQDAEAGASFMGLSGVHGAPEMARAVMEGVVFSMREGLEIARTLMPELPAQIVASGGGARSALWRQIQADVYGLPVRTTAIKEQACLGAAILGGVASGAFESIAEGCARTVRFDEEITEPIPANAALYEEMYETAYRGFYVRNQDLYAKLFRWRNADDR